MNIKELLDSNPNGIAIVSLQDLKEFLREIVKEVDNENRVEKEEYYSSAKIAEATLYRWTREKYLPAVKIGHRNLYRQSDVEALFKLRCA